MLLAINVGNTETKLGVFHDRELAFSRRIATHPARRPVPRSDAARPSRCVVAL